MEKAKSTFVRLNDLEVYQLARELSRIAWSIYENFDWKDRKIVGDQFITSTDSVGANIAEGHGRFHYLDKIRFFYQGRGSLAEAVHWIEILGERKKVSCETASSFKSYADKISIKLQNLITVTYTRKKKT